MNRHLETLQVELAKSLDGLDERQTQLRPANDSARWNIQQIVGHLRLTYIATLEAMDARIVKAAATKAKPSPLQYAAQFTLVFCGYFPRGRRAPERVTVAIDEVPLSGSALSGEITTALTTMASRIDQAETIFGNRRRAISHMALGPLSTAQWRKFHLVHGRHHIRQITAIRREHGI